MTTCLRILALATLVLAQVRVASGKTVNQVPFLDPSGPVVVQKLTRSYVEGQYGTNLFGGLGAAAIFTNHTTLADKWVTVTVDPVWSRLLYAAEDGPIVEVGGYGGGLGQFRNPRSLDITPEATIYVADTFNNRIAIYHAPLSSPDSAKGVIRDSLGFRLPDKVVWDDNGTPSAFSDDALWVLDIAAARIAGYHVQNLSAGYKVTPYVYIASEGVGSRRLARPIAITKGRSYSAPNERGSFCTEDLYVYDSILNRFLIYSVPRVVGFIPPSEVPTTVPVRVIPNPLPTAHYVDLSTDTWGNIFAVDAAGNRICKFDRNLVLLDTYGSFGIGPLGSEQMRGPARLAFGRRLNSDGSFTQTRDAVLVELWGPNTGVQRLTAGVSASGPALASSAVGWGGSFTFSITEHCRARIEAINPANGLSVGIVVAETVRGVGANAIAWDGRLTTGAFLPPCKEYDFRLRAISLYDQPETTFVTQRISYQPRAPVTLNVNSSQPGWKLTFDGRDTTLTGSSFAAPCSTCTTHTLSAVGRMSVAGLNYCFGTWGNALPRTHSLVLSGDSTVTLSLTPPGSGPTSVPVGAALVDDAFDCKSPYIFGGSGTLTTSSPTGTFRTWGNVSLRVTKNLGASLRIDRPLIAKGARFESTDSTAGAGNLWDGLRLSTDGAVFLDSCVVRNAYNGITNYSGTTVSSASVDRTSFDNYNLDVSLAFDPTRTPSARFVGNTFSNKAGLFLLVGGTSMSPVATATVTDNFFNSSSGNGSLAFTGGWQGQAWRNRFAVNQMNSWGVYLNRYSTYASPAVSFRNNDFNIVAGNGRKAFKAPPKAGALVQIDALYNDWDYDTRQQIEDIIDHDTDNTALAIVSFEPWTHPPGGGGGGGGGGGCPFVLTETAEGLNVENSILGLSKVTGANVSDAYPFRGSLERVDGKVRLRIAELGTDVDKIDQVTLLAVAAFDGYQLGSDGVGHPVLYKPMETVLEQQRWTGKGGAFVSPVAPGSSAYQGAAGDSLDFRVGADGTVIFPGKRRFGINLIPKPTAAPIPGEPVGVTVRVSPDAEGERWYTLDDVIPRENWSPALLPLDILGVEPVRMVRVVWHSTHTLGWVGVATAEAATTSTIPFVSAQHSSGASVLADLAQKDGRDVTINPGEYVELEFDASKVPEGTRFVLLTHGRYSQPGHTAATEVPKVYSLAQNRPNPFNPSTEIGFGLPAPSRVDLRVYSVSGRLVRVVVNGSLPAGFHRAQWDGRSDQGGSVASGVYFYELRAGSFTDRRRMVLLR